MIVLKNNYKQIFPLFKESLEMCEFLSFDCEMTGVTCDLKTDATKYDNAQFRYYKSREIVKKYELIQVGVTFYIRREVEPKVKESELIYENANENNGNENKDEIRIKEKERIVNDKFYLERTFTFFLFKNSKLRFLSDLYSHRNENAIFSSFTTCHPATLKFLNENHFDLNNIISGGIHYNKLAHIDKIKSAIRNYTTEGKLPNSIVHLSKVNETKIIDAMKQIAKFFIYGKDIMPDPDAKANAINEKDKKGNKKNQSAEKIIKIDNLNVFLINYLLSINLKKVFKIQNFNLSRDKTDTTGSTLIVEKSKAVVNVEEFNKLYGSYDNFCKILNMEMIMKARYSQFIFNENEEEALIEDELGFSKFIQLIIEYNSTRAIPIVGHNIFFDLLFIYDKFIDDLPESFYEFKKNFHRCFPIIFDNKFLTVKLAKEFENTKLDSLYKSMKKSKYDVYVPIKPDVVNGFSYYHDLESTNFHDAGFDSIVTGRCFVYLLKAVENLFEVENKKGSKHQIGREELKNVKGIEIKTGFVDFNMRDRILYDFTNKSVLSMMEEPFDVCDFMLENESFEDFLYKEEKLIKNLFTHIYVVVLKSVNDNMNNMNKVNPFYSIYDFARLFENNLFNISIVKIDDFVAFIEFIPIDQNYQSEKEKLELLREMIDSFKSEKDSIESIIHYSDFYKNYPHIIKF